jgi:hypothetical protein
MEKRQRNNGVDWATEKINVEPSLKQTTNVEVMTIESPEVPLTSEATPLRKIKPRAIIFKANDKDFCKLNDFIKTQFPEVEIVYVTTGPVASFLRVIKSIPFELQNSSEQPNYTIE